MNHKIYLDNNGTTFLAPEVRHLLIQVFDTLISNPSSAHSFGKQTNHLLQKARHSISAALSVKPSELIFTSGGTENANMILRGVLSKKNQNHLVTSTIEHACVYATAQHIEKLGCEVTYLSPTIDGQITADAIKLAIKPTTRLIAIMAVNNETGARNDIEAIAKVAESYKIPLFVDGVALLGKDAVVIYPGVTMMSFSGHKIHAPQGIGVIFVRSGFKFDPLIIGGEQENGRRAGTENILGILAFAKALEIISTDLPSVAKRMENLRDLFEEMILTKVPLVTINGGQTRIGNVSNLAFSGVDGEGLLIALDLAGVIASHGSACASGAMEPSRILLKMGLPIDRVRSSIRFSLSRYTTKEDIVKAVNIICSCVQKIRLLNQSSLT